MKKNVVILTILILILTVLVIITFKLGDFKISEENLMSNEKSQNDKIIEIYQFGEVTQENNIFKYTNKWKFSNSDVHGNLTIKYDEENHTISRKNEVSSGNIKEFAKRRKSN